MCVRVCACACPHHQHPTPLPSFSPNPTMSLPPRPCPTTRTGTSMRDGTAISHASHARSSLLAPTSSDQPWRQNSVRMRPGVCVCVCVCACVHKTRDVGSCRSASSFVFFVVCMFKAHISTRTCTHTNAHTHACTQPLNPRSTCATWLLSWAVFSTGTNHRA